MWVSLRLFRVFKMVIGVLREREREKELEDELSRSFGFV